MTRPRGRPEQGKGVAKHDILDAALILLGEGGQKGLTMRALASRLGVTPMSLYHHIEDRAGLLLALSDRIYGEVLQVAGSLGDGPSEIQALLTAYHDAVGRHPKLTLAIFAEPKAFAGVTRQLTERLTTLLASITTQQLVWRDILIDHAHGSGLAMSLAAGDPHLAHDMREQYRLALECLLKQLMLTEQVSELRE
jgi:AcrR family transcriptional regulator